MMFKSVLNKIITVVCAACIVTTTFIYSAVNVSASSSLTESQTELAEAYCEFFNEMYEGNAIASLTIALVDIPLSWYDYITDLGDVLWIGDDIYYYLVGDDLYVSRGGAGGRVCYTRGGGGGASRDDLHITGDVFANVCTQLEEQYSPKNTANYISWRTDKRYSEQTQALVSPHMTFFTEGYFCGQSNWQEVYLVPFYTDGTNDYYGQYQFHFYQELTTDENGNNVITLYVDYWNMVEDTEPTTVTVSDKLTDYRYIDFSQMTATNALYFVPHSTYTSYLNLTRSSVITKTLSITSDCYLTDYLNIDGLSFADLSSATDLGKHFRDSVTTHDESCELGDGCNIGYYCSNTPVEMDFSGVDFSQFTAEDTVTLSGDTIYDYTITNTSGDSTTINNYITNNYNYPVSEDSSGEEGGSASGNVNVSGNIDVGGSVDVNINVNQSGSSDSNTSAYEYENVNLGEALEQIPEMGDGFIGFFSRVFDWLPAPIFGLIVGGLGLAIVLRIAGR